MRPARRIAPALGGALALWAACCGGAPAQESPAVGPAADAGAQNLPGPAGAGTTIRPDPLPAPRRGNPLWAIPLKTLAATRERPLFSPSRRPPPRAETPDAPPPPPPPPAPAAATQAAPPFTLIGTVVNGSDGFAVFLDPATREVARLRTGEGHLGWILRAVSLRDATLERDRATVVLLLPAREAEGAATPSRSAGKPANVVITLPPGPGNKPVDPFE